jgi:hypothetical protein
MPDRTPEARLDPRLPGVRRPRPERPTEMPAGQALVVRHEVARYWPAPLPQSARGPVPQPGPPGPARAPSKQCWHQPAGARPAHHPPPSHWVIHRQAATFLRRGASFRCEPKKRRHGTAGLDGAADGRGVHPRHRPDAEVAHGGGPNDPRGRPHHGRPSWSPKSATSPPVSLSRVVVLLGGAHPRHRGSDARPYGVGSPSQDSKLAHRA